MFCTHIFVIIIHQFRHSFSWQTELGAMMKTFCTILIVTVYQAAIINIFVKSIHAKEKLETLFTATVDREDCLFLARRMLQMNNYRQFEFASFLCIFVGLFIYVIACKALRYIKKWLSSDEEVQELKNSGDPFWYILLGHDDEDFLARSNFILNSFAMIFYNISLALLGYRVIKAD